MKFAACLLVAFVCSGAFASEPGQPMDCSDMVFHVPGLTCRPFVPIGQIQGDPCNTDLWWRGSNLALDNLGRFLYVKFLNDPSRTEVRRSDGATEELLVSMTARWTPFGWDGVSPFSLNGPFECGEARAAVTSGLEFDAANGRIIVRLVSRSSTAGGGSQDYAWIASIEGFATTFEILQTYTPQPALGFRVPYMPEGMAGADRFDTFWGPLAKPLDFTQAHPLACDYPVAAPQVGDYLTVADTVPSPPPGQGVYYVTAATYQGATRYGRKTTAGHLTGRDPALLPACATP